MKSAKDKNRDYIREMCSRARIKIATFESMIKEVQLNIEDTDTALALASRLEDEMKQVWPTRWRDDDSPQAEKTFGAHKIAQLTF